MTDPRIPSLARQAELREMIEDRLKHFGLQLVHVLDLRLLMRLKHLGLQLVHVLDLRLLMQWLDAEIERANAAEAREREATAKYARDLDNYHHEMAGVRAEAFAETERANAAEVAVSLSEDLRKHPMGSDAEQKWRADERAEIVAWLRGEEFRNDESAAYHFASRIEQLGPKPAKEK
jgi:hypothetical protein